MPGRRSKKKRAQRQLALLGQVTRSQAISTFGPGSIFELRKSDRNGNSVNSVMICGIDSWKVDPASRIEEPALARSLGVNGFLLPPPVSEQKQSWATPSEFVSAVRFPKWLVCNRCERLGIVGVHFRDSGKQPMCNGGNCRGRGVPVRLVSACFNPKDDNGQPGHIDDFPWIWWAHSKSDERCENYLREFTQNTDHARSADQVRNKIFEIYRSQEKTMSEKKKNIKKETRRPKSLMAVQAKLGLFDNKKDNKNKEVHEFLKKPPLGFL